MKVFIIAIIALASITGSNAQQFWRACGTSPAPTSVTSPNCGTSCVVTRDQNLIATAVFTPTEAHATLTSRFVAVIAGIEAPLETADACPQVTGGCPRAAGVQTTWNINVPIDNSVPQLTNVPVRGALDKSLFFHHFFKNSLNILQFHFLMAKPLLFASKSPQLSTCKFDLSSFFYTCIIMYNQFMISDSSLSQSLSYPSYQPSYLCCVY